MNKNARSEIKHVLATLLAVNVLALWSSQLTAQTAANVVCRSCVGTTDLANNAVNGAKVINNSITGADVRNASLTGVDIRDNSLTGRDVRDGSIAFEDLAADAVFSQTIIVSPVGSDNDNCAVLYAAHDAIADAGQRNHYLLYIEPGIYDCRGLGPLTMKEYVDITGAGKDATLVVGDGLTSNSATVIAANHSTLSNLEVLNQPQGGATRSQALLVSNVSNFAVHNARLRAIFGTACFALETAGAATFSMQHVIVRADSDCGTTTGVEIAGGSTVSMHDVDVAVTGLIALAAHGNVTARNSRFKGVRDAVFYSVATVARFVSTQLDGRLTFDASGVGSLKCVGSYDGSFTALGADCN